MKFAVGAFLVLATILVEVMVTIHSPVVGWIDLVVRENDSTATDESQEAVSVDFQPTAPYHASFFYLWYQQPKIAEKWSYWDDHGNNPPHSWFSYYLPDFKEDVFWLHQRYSGMSIENISS